MRRALATAALSLVLAALVWTAPSAQQPAYDIVIRGGRVFDGMGNPWILADVAIRDGRFVKIGRASEAGRVEIDPRGRYMSPGWIDMMDQSGAVLSRNGLAENKLRMGVTTALIYPPSSFASTDELVEMAKVVIDHDKHTGVRAGHVLYGPGRRQ